ncbi:unnamed protein product [Pedinophyceae sp. YPF-701]|nr:unnamed protein product [Pedinophyceae sp. YPF-701]
MGLYRSCAAAASRALPWLSDAIDPVLKRQHLSRIAPSAAARDFGAAHPPGGRPRTGAVAPHGTRMASATASPAGDAEDIPVVIAGAGPTGLALSGLLSGYGVPSVVLEAKQAPSTHPAAHFVNNRTMEVLRHMRGLDAAVAAESPPLEQWRRFIYCETMSDEPLATVDHFAGAPPDGRVGAPAPGAPRESDASASPVAPAHLSQPRLVELLAQHATAVGGPDAVRRGWRVLDVRAAQDVPADADREDEPPADAKDLHAGHVHASLGIAALTGVDAGIAGPWDAPPEGRAGPGPLLEVEAARQGAGGVEERRVFRCRYLVGADGAHSTVRGLAGIQMVGEPALQHLISAHVVSRELADAALTSGRTAMLYFVYGPAAIAVLIAHDLRRGEFVVQIPYFPPHQTPERNFTTERVAAVVRAAAGAQLTDLEVLDVRPWTMSAEVAETYRAGHIVLAGDAAHRFPPAGGFGMNTGVQDAHALAWRLAAILHHGAPASALLDAYVVERRAIGRANCDLSVANWQGAARVPAALGLDPRAASFVSGALESASKNLGLPSFLTSGALSAALSVGQAFSGTRGPLGPARRAALSRALGPETSLRLQFPEHDLGYTYGRGGWPAVHEGRHKRGGGGGAPWVQEVCMGGRMPHVAIERRGAEGSITEMSTLDLVRNDKPVALVLCRGGCAWDEAVASECAAVKAGPLKGLVEAVVVESGEGESRAAESGVAERVRDVAARWPGLPGCVGPVVVRPDGHVSAVLREPLGWSTSRAGVNMGIASGEAAVLRAAAHALGLEAVYAAAS